MNAADSARHEDFDAGEVSEVRRRGDGRRARGVLCDTRGDATPRDLAGTRAQPPENVKFGVGET